MAYYLLLHTSVLIYCGKTLLFQFYYLQLFIEYFLCSRKIASFQINLSGQKGVVSMHYLKADPPFCLDKFIWNDAIFLERRKYLFILGIK